MRGERADRPLRCQGLFPFISFHSFLFWYHGTILWNLWTHFYLSDVFCSLSHRRAFKCHCDDINHSPALLHSSFHLSFSFSSYKLNHLHSYKQPVSSLSPLPCPTYSFTLSLILYSFTTSSLSYLFVTLSASNNPEMVFLGVCSDRTSCSKRISSIKSDLESVSDTLSPSFQMEYFLQQLLLTWSRCSKLSGIGEGGAQWNRGGGYKLEWGGVVVGGDLSKTHPQSSSVVLVCPCLCTRLHLHPLYIWIGDVNVSVLIQFNAAVDVCTVTQKLGCLVW